MNITCSRNKFFICTFSRIYSPYTNYLNLIFKNFVKNAVKKENARPFKVPQGIKMLVVNSVNGERASYNDESIIIEAFKDKDLVNNSGDENKIQKETKSQVEII